MLPFNKYLSGKKKKKKHEEYRRGRERPVDKLTTEPLIKDGDDGGSQTDTGLQRGERLLYEAIEVRQEQWVIGVDYHIHIQIHPKMNKLRFANLLNEAKQILLQTLSVSSSIEFPRNQQSPEQCIARMLLARASIEIDNLDEAQRYLESSNITREALKEWFANQQVSDYIQKRSTIFAGLASFIKLLLMERKTRDTTMSSALEEREVWEEEVKGLEIFLMEHLDIATISEGDVMRLTSYNVLTSYWLEEMWSMLPFFHFQCRNIRATLVGLRRYLVLFSGRVSFRKIMVLRALSDLLTMYVSDINYVKVMESLPVEWRKLGEVSYYVPTNRWEELQLLVMIEEWYVPSNLPFNVSSDITHLPSVYGKAFQILMQCQNYTLLEDIALNGMEKGYDHSEEFNIYYMIKLFITGHYREAFMLFDYLKKHDLKDPFVYLIASLGYLDGLYQVRTLDSIREHFFLFFMVINEFFFY
jgi:hypothetical protein